MLYLFCACKRKSFAISANLYWTRAVELSAEYGTAKVIEQHTLECSLHRTGSELRIVAFASDEGDSVVVDMERDAFI